MPNHMDHIVKINKEKEKEEVDINGFLRWHIFMF